MNLLLDAGADDIRDNDDNWEVLGAPENHNAMVETLEKAGIPTESAEIAMVPKNLLTLEGKNASGMMRLSDALEEHDDVQSVYSNFDVDEKEVEALA
jgi:transcriptional/translational regulatory protein YebC/TACO1